MSLRCGILPADFSLHGERTFADPVTHAGAVHPSTLSCSLSDVSQQKAGERISMHSLTPMLLLTTRQREMEAGR